MSCTLTQWAINDFRSSAVPDDLTLANVFTVEGDRAIEMLAGPSLDKLGGHSRQYATGQVKCILNRYQFAAAGLWVAYGDTLDGIGGAVAYAKPFTPRPDPHKLGKVVKYETPQGQIAAPILPIVPDTYAAAIFQRWGISPHPGEPFWDTVARCPGCPVAIVEGLKKALALIAQGIPAIAIRGVTQWHRKGAVDLHPELAAIATKGRELLVIFDQDAATKTRAAVSIQARKLGTVLESHGCKVRVPSWDVAQGKGIDDCLYALGDGAGEWLQATLDNAPTLREYKGDARLAAAMAAIRRHNRLTFPIERETEGDYLPQLPPLTPGAIHVVDANMGSGKTYRIGRDWVQAALDRNHHVLVLSPLNSLGQQTAVDWRISHIHDAGTGGQQQREFWDALRDRPGVAMCPDSIGKLPRWFWQRPVLLVVDEGNQTTSHITAGDTFGSRYAALVEGVTAAAQHAIASGGAIVLSEDGVPDRCVKWWQQVSNASTVRCFVHKRTADPWDVTAYSGAVSGFRAGVLAALKRGDRILFVTSSQRESKRLHRIATGAGINAVRIDGETNEGGRFDEFFRSPDQWLRDNAPQLLILSPSAKTGVSIEGNVSVEDAYFDSVWGYFPSLETDTHAQLLGRYRPAVPRHIYCPPFINPGADESLYSPSAIKHRQRTNLATIAKLFEVATLDETQTAIEAAIADYLALASAVAGSQKSIAAAALVSRLEAAGHCVRDVEVKGSKATAELWKETQDEIWRDEAGEIAALELDPDTHTPDWAYRTLDSHEAGRELRLTARKVLLRDEFPGVTFDGADECYQALTLDYGAMIRGVRLQARAENLDAAKAGDRDAVEALLRGNVRASHRLPKNYVRAGIINRLGILTMLDGSTWCNADKRCQSIKAIALRYRDEIRYWLRLNISEDQTPVEVVNKLLRKLGIVAKAIARPGRRGQQGDRIYAAENLDNPIRVRLLEALRGKLSGSVSTICNKESDPLQIMDTSPQTPIPIGVGALVRVAKTGAIALIEALDGAIATLGDELGRVWQAPVGELLAA